MDQFNEKLQTDWSQFTVREGHAVAVRDQERGGSRVQRSTGASSLTNHSEKRQHGLRPRAGLVHQGTSPLVVAPSWSPIQCYSCSCYSAWSKHSDSVNLGEALSVH